MSWKRASYAGAAPVPGSTRSRSWPPTRKSVSRLIGASSVPPPNQRAFRLGSAQAAKTRAGGWPYVRSIVKVEWTTDRSGIGDSLGISRAVRRGSRRVDRGVAPRSSAAPGSGGQRHRKRLRQLGHRRRAAAEPLDDRASGGVGEGLEDQVQLRLRVKHLL